MRALLNSLLLLLAEGECKGIWRYAHQTKTPPPHTAPAVCFHGM